MSAAADRAPEAEVPPQPGMMQQIDGTVSSTPSRSSNFPRAYDEDNDNYSEGIQVRAYMTLITYLRSTAFPMLLT